MISIPASLPSQDHIPEMADAEAQKKGKAVASSVGQQFRSERPQRVRRNLQDHSVATEAKPVHPMGQPINASTKAESTVRGVS